MLREFTLPKTGTSDACPSLAKTPYHRVRPAQIEPLSTHELAFAHEVADHIYFTDRGVFVEHGPAEKFFKNVKDPRTKEFLSQILLRVQGFSHFHPGLRGMLYLF